MGTLTPLADILRIALVAFAAALLADGDESGALKSVLVLAPAVAARLVRVPPVFDLLLTLALAGEAVGTVLGGGWLGLGDGASHLLVPLLCAPVVYQLLVRLSAIVPPEGALDARRLAGAGIVSAVGVLALGAAWELVEWGADRAFGTDYSQGYTDTLSDLLADTGAAALGGVLVALWLRRTAATAAGPPDRGQPEASVVIPTYARRGSIEQVVRAVLADEAAREVIVVVDGCDDGTYECLLELAREDARVRPVWQENAGQNAALQNGVRQARYPVVVLLDDDVLAEPGLITGHARHHSAGRRQVVLGYMPVREASTWPDRVTARLYSMGYEDQCRVWESDPQGIIGLLWAGNMSLRRSDALQVSLDNPDHPFHYLRDRELGLRLMKAGFSAVFDRSLRATHLYSRSLKQLRRDAQCSGRGRWALHDLHGDVLGPAPPNPFEGGPWAPRLVVSLGGGRAGPALAALLAAVAHVLGRLGATRTSARHYGLLWGVLERREYIAERRRRQMA
jgi:GT2 family glycosyltransferase